MKPATKRPGPAFSVLVVDHLLTVVFGDPGKPPVVVQVPPIAVLGRDPAFGRPQLPLGEQSTSGCPFSVFPTYRVSYDAKCLMKDV